MRSEMIAATFVALLTGCTFSVHPVLTLENLTSDVNLTGTWERQAPPRQGVPAREIVMSFDGFDNNSSYDAVLKENSQEFEVQVGKIGDERVLQIIRTDLSLKNEAPILARVPVYGFAKFAVKNDVLHVFPVKDQGVRGLLKSNGIAFLNYEPSDMLSWCIITDPTSKVQTLIREHGDQLFLRQPIVFHRVRKPEDGKDRVDEKRETSSTASSPKLKQPSD